MRVQRRGDPPPTRLRAEVRRILRLLDRTRETMRQVQFLLAFEKAPGRRKSRLGTYQGKRAVTRRYNRT